MHQGLVKTRYQRCSTCEREAAFDTVRGVCTVLNCKLYG